MRILTFSRRCAKEILRDPLNLVFGLGFPVAILLLLSAIQANIPVALFEIDRLTPGITVFGVSFMTLFSSTLIAKDRESAFLQRLYTTPIKPSEYILGYMLPLIPIAVAQCIVCYIVAIFFGLQLRIEILYAVIMILPIAVFNVSLGLLCGSVFNVKQVGGLCGALLTNVTAWFSGVWFDLELVGDAFGKIAKLLPFVHAVELERATLCGNFTQILPHLGFVLGYTVITMVCATILFLRQMKSQ